VQELLGFDDAPKKKIIGESVRTSSCDFHSEGSGLWLGHFVLRRSWQSGSCCGGAIVDAIKSNAIPKSAFCCVVLEDGSRPQKHFYKDCFYKERFYKEEE
jgi:hypothetical protein